MFLKAIRRAPVMPQRNFATLVLAEQFEGKMNLGFGSCLKAAQDLNDPQVSKLFSHSKKFVRLMCSSMDLPHPWATRSPSSRSTQVSARSTPPPLTISTTPMEEQFLKSLNLSLRRMATTKWLLSAQASARMSFQDWVDSSTCRPSPTLLKLKVTSSWDPSTLEMPFALSHQMTRSSSWPSEEPTSIVFHSLATIPTTSRKSTESPTSLAPRVASLWRTLCLSPRWLISPLPSTSLAEVELSRAARTSRCSTTLQILSALLTVPSELLEQLLMLAWYRMICKWAKPERLSPQTFTLQLESLVPFSTFQEWKTPRSSWP